MFGQGKRGCKDGCSFYQIEYDFLQLPDEDQKSLKRSSVLSDDSVDLSRLGKLLFDTQRTTCIGGLIEPGEVRKRCPIFAKLSGDLDRENLISVFTARNSRRSQLPWQFATLALAIFTVVLGYFQYANLDPTELKQKNQLLSAGNATLQANVEKLGRQIEKLKDEKTNLSVECGITRAELERTNSALDTCKAQINPQP